ncbi:MAG TPA: heavy-metal-associated domain-containing protein [Treponemataceae bacterium]|nr:heavy-metal-associated domain-containing protein [Treponemataceae bacterium]HQL04984.1 heavy-metal-associated domain-containing protein [Treponemataceae bacterium]
MKKASIQLETLTCPSCAQKIENAVKATAGADKESVKVLFNASKVKFDYDEGKASIDDFVKAIEKMGYEVKNK